MICVKLVTPFVLEGLGPDGCVEVPDGAHVGDLFGRVRGWPLYARLWPVAVNGQQAKRSQRLKAGDTVVFIAPIGGG